MIHKAKSTLTIRFVNGSEQKFEFTRLVESFTNLDLQIVHLSPRTLDFSPFQKGEEYVFFSALIVVEKETSLGKTKRKYEID